MSRNLTTFIAAMLVMAFTTGKLGAADQPNPAEARMREALRNTMIQLRTAQNDNVVLQTAKGELESKNKGLDAQVKLLTKNIADDKDAAEKTITNLNTKLAGQAEEIAKLKENLAQTQAKLNDTDALAKSKEAERARLAADVIVLNRTVADQKTKNAEMYKLGKEILLRYEKFGLGDVIGAKEPFVGTQRVKLETYVQDFQDKLTDQKVKN